MRTPPNYIVKLPRRGGHGVLVGHVILTAAHCLEFTMTGEMVLGDYFIEEVQTRLGRLKVRPLAVKPCADIAVLGTLDEQEFWNEAEAFDKFCRATKPVPVAGRQTGPCPPFPVRIYNTSGQWVNGTVEVTNESGPSVWMKVEKAIKGGASGGPILNLKGELVSLVSNSSVPNGQVKSTGLCPRLLHALPVWVCRKFLGL